MVTNSNSTNSKMYESNLKQNGRSSSFTNNLGGGITKALKNSSISSGNIHNQHRNHLKPDIIVTSKSQDNSSSSSSSSHHCEHPSLVNSHKSLTTNSSSMMHSSQTMMDIKSLQKSNTFTSSLSSGGLKIGSWFDRRARKISMKCSKSMTLGKTKFLSTTRKSNQLLGINI